MPVYFLYRILRKNFKTGNSYNFRSKSLHDISVFLKYMLGRSMSSPKFSVNFLQDKENITEEKMLNKLSSPPLLFQKTF